MLHPLAYTNHDNEQLLQRLTMKIEGSFNSNLQLISALRPKTMSTDSLALCISLESFQLVLYANCPVLAQPDVLDFKGATTQLPSIQSNFLRVTFNL